MSLKQATISPDLRAKNDEIARLACDVVEKLPKKPSVTQLLVAFGEINGVLHTPPCVWDGTFKTWKETQELIYSAPISNLRYLGEYVEMFRPESVARLRRFFKAYGKEVDKLARFPALNVCLEQATNEFLLKINGAVLEFASECALE